MTTQPNVRPSWDQYFMDIALMVSKRSNCCTRQVAALIIKDKRIISTGYNGTPRGTKNCDEGGCARCWARSHGTVAAGTQLDECTCSHGEENAIVQASYHGVAIKDSTLYTTFCPCLMCAKMCINAGIKEIVFAAEYPLNDMARDLLEQAGVALRKL
ncbi:MAG: cytidine deaminase [Candidatus Magasanikbacteria bacterium RIFCSPHIGHO2_01_FULL_50_8]|uniref:Cytidine deaminase n=2 Tax=Candidatus Magasanikiibacteriota TaxID=1752731 RepID=A0A1F6LRX6_9BACT|nr:MAG: cytidine deaminase [Candidatus Magasanikbacteria bacterium RIFCSPHIGHO2_01_FULL_50_8]OGH67484.1 MAG: cytidine deaminase [Candidatus Magasanikbacteria bacterium RIFCSPHIGHO2_02_FULL_50_9b]